MSHKNFMEKLLGGVEVEWKALREVTLPTSNIRWRDVERTYRYIDLTSVSIEAKKITETSEVTANKAPSRAQKLVEGDDVIFATTRPAQQRYCLIDDEYAGEVASTGYCVLRAKKNVVLPKWILYCIASTDFKTYVEENQSGSAYPAISDAKVKEFQIPIPPLKIQSEIVQILDNFTELTAELTARKKQYNYYRDKLLSFEDGEVERKTLGEVVRIKNGKDHKTLGDGNFPVYGSGGIMRYADTYAYNKPSVLIPRKGSLGNLFFVEVPFWNVDTIFYTEINEEQIRPKFLYYFLTTVGLGGMNQAVGVPSQTQSVLNSLEIPVPPLTEQARIVAILDKFDALTHSLTEGLPREIALRQKQYEHYRELLLNFPK
jgi:type I restriction enzyme, S subunit